VPDYTSDWGYSLQGRGTKNFTVDFKIVAAPDNPNLSGLAAFMEVHTNNAYAYLGFLQNASGVFLQLEISDGTNDVITNGTHILSVNTWYNIKMQENLTSTKTSVNVYVNNELDSTATVSGNYGNVQYGTFDIFNQLWGSSNCFTALDNFVESGIVASIPFTTDFEDPSLSEWSKYSHLNITDTWSYSGTHSLYNPFSDTGMIGILLPNNATTYYLSAYFYWSLITLRSDIIVVSNYGYSQVVALSINYTPSGNHLVVYCSGTPYVETVGPTSLSLNTPYHIMLLAQISTNPAKNATISVWLDGKPEITASVNNYDGNNFFNYAEIKMASPADEVEYVDLFTVSVSSSLTATTLISGDALGNFHSFFWDGSTWGADDTRVAGLGNIGGTSGGWNYSTPHLSYNVTGDGNWTLISGRYNGDFRGFYWNGSQWIEKSSYVQGLGDIGSESAPSIAFNVTGDSKWTLIAGEHNGFYAFYWNGSQWVSDSTRKTGLRGVDGEHSFIPDLAYNLRGDDKWSLIAGGFYYPTYGYEWNGSQWNFYGLVVANAIWQIGNYPEVAPAFIYNLTGSGKWHLIGGAYNGNFYGLTLQAPTTANQIVELGRALLDAGQNYVYGFTVSGGYIYGGTQTLPSQVIKFSIGTMEKVANFTLATDDGYTEESCAIVVGDYLYLGNWKSPGPARIVKVDLTTFTKVSTLMLDSTDTSIWDLASDDTYLYAACSTAHLVRINLTDFTRKDNLTLSATPYSLQYENGYLYAGVSSGLLYKIDVSTFSVTNTLDVDTGLSVPIDCLASKGDGWLYAGYTDSSPVGYIRKVNLTTFSNDARLQVGASGSGIYVDHMVIVGDNLFFLDSKALRQVYLPSFALGTYRYFIENSYDLATDGFYVYVSPGTAPAMFEKFYFTGAVLHSVTVTANPSINVHFSIDGIIYTTPYVTNLPEGTHTFQVLDVFPKSGNFFLIYEHWTFNGVDDNGGAYATITKNINVASTLVIHYHVGVLELKFEDDFETGNLNKWTGTDLQTGKIKPGSSTCEVTGAAKYGGSYGLQANGVSDGYGGHAFAYKTNSPMNYVYLNFMVYVPTGQTRGWFGLLRPHGLTMTLSETGYTDTPDCTQFSVGWHYSNFEVVYWIGDMELIKSDISGFQFNTWYNITMFLKTGSDGFYALWVNGVLKWYRFHDDTSLWGGYSSYVGARAWTSSKTNYVDDVKISAFVDPTFVTLTVNSTPLEIVAFTINGAQYYTPTSMLLTPGTYQLAVTDTFPMINETRYAFTHWSKMASPQIDIYTATFNLVLTVDTNLTIHYAVGAFYVPSPPVVPEEITYCLPLIFYILMIVMFFAGLYFYSKRDTWMISIPLIPIILWLIILQPKTPIDQMPIALLRYFTVPPWHLYMAIILTIIAVCLLLSKREK